VELSSRLQINTALFDGTGVCVFMGFPTLDDPNVRSLLIDLLNAKDGVSKTVDE